MGSSGKVDCGPRPQDTDKVFLFFYIVARFKRSFLLLFFFFFFFFIAFSFQCCIAISLFLLQEFPHWEAAKKDTLKATKLYVFAMANIVQRPIIVYSKPDCSIG